MAKAYLNALYEEGSRADLLEWLVRLDKENDQLKDENALLIKRIAHQNSGSGEIKVSVGSIHTTY